MALAIEAEGIVKTFRSGWWRRRVKEVLKGINLQVEEGEIFGILGPNGAGKTTLLSILSTLLPSDQGSVRILGIDGLKDGHRIRERVNISSGNANFIWSLSVIENLRFYGMLYGLSGKRREAKIEFLIDLFGLKEHLEVPFDRLSTGLKQRLSLAKSLLNDPFQLISGAWLIGMGRSFLVFLLLSIFGGIAFGFNFFQSGVISLILYLLGLFMIAVSIGIAVCILVILFGYKAEVAAWSITSLMALICGIYYPVSVLPSPFPDIARAIPLTYFLEYFRSFYGFEREINDVLFRGFGLIGLYLIVEAVLLRWVIRHARKNGTFIKLSE